VYGDIHRKVLGGAQVRFIDNNPEHRVETLRDSKKKQSLFMTAGAIPDDRSFPWFLCVTEAPIDALSLSSAGIPAVATLGATSVLPDWILNVLKFPAFVILASDNDEKGQDMAADIQQQIQARMPAEHSLILPSGLWKSRSVVIRHPRTGKDWNEVLVKSGVNAVRHELESDPEYNLTDEVLRHLMS
jgi:DNA primase